MSVDFAEAQALLHQKIPITRAMGVHVIAYERGALTLQAPLDLNYNHMGTAFGGSLGSLAMLTGYALLWLELQSPDCHVVVRDCAMSFRRPVREDLRAVGKLPDEAVMTKFRNHLARRKKARLKIEVQIMDGDAVALEFTGTFVAVIGSSN